MLATDSWFGTKSGTPNAGEATMQRPSAVGKPPSANGASASGSSSQPAARSASKSSSGRNAARASVSSSSAKQGSAKPICKASSRKICVFGFASPSGAIAGSLISAQVWP